MVQHQDLLLLQGRSGRQCLLVRTASSWFHADTMTAADLSIDQMYLYELCDAVSKVICSVTLSRQNPGELFHSRWSTAANVWSVAFIHFN